MMARSDDRQLQQLAGDTFQLSSGPPPVIELSLDLFQGDGSDFLRDA
jgi:hypothetical protein